MLVLAFLTDPDVVAKILRHLGLPTDPPPLTPASSSLDEPLPGAQLPLYPNPDQGDSLASADGEASADWVHEEAAPAASYPTIRPPP
jgi:hypothetical protein